MHPCITQFGSIDAACFSGHLKTWQHLKPYASGQMGKYFLYARSSPFLPLSIRELCLLQTGKQLLLSNLEAEIKLSLYCPSIVESLSQWKGDTDVCDHYQSVITRSRKATGLWRICCLHLEEPSSSYRIVLTQVQKAPVLFLECGCPFSLTIRYCTKWRPGKKKKSLAFSRSLHTWA